MGYDELKAAIRRRRQPKLHQWLVSDLKGFKTHLRVRFNYWVLVGAVVVVLLLLPFLLMIPERVTMAQSNVTYKTYNTTTLSFQYPDTWKPIVEDKGSVKLVKGDDWVVVNKLNTTTYLKHYNNYLEEGWRDRGNKTIAGTVCTVFMSPAEVNSDTLVYLFMKDTGYYEILARNNYMTQNLVEDLVEGVR